MMMYLALLSSNLFYLIDALRSTISAKLLTIHKIDRQRETETEIEREGERERERERQTDRQTDRQTERVM